MAIPSFVNFLKLVAGDVQILQLGALKGWELIKFIERDVQPLQVYKSIFLGKDAEILNSVV